MTTTKGIVMFAHNNTEIDYVRMALLNSRLIQRHMGLRPDQITIVSDKHSLDYTLTTMSDSGENIIVVEKDAEFKRMNIRTYKDTSHTPKQLSFYNANRYDVYELSPYDETIVLDADYLVLSDALNQCWEHNNELMMNWEYNDVMAGREFTSLRRVGPLGISMYWATVVYFRKTPDAQTFFNFVKHVKNNQQFYKDLYQYQGRIYRNDYSFSIAAHMLGGFQDKSVEQLPVSLYKTFDLDDIEDVLTTDEFVLLLEKQGTLGDFIATRWKGIDLHVMNKWAINRITDKLLELLDEKESTY